MNKEVLIGQETDEKIKAWRGKYESIFYTKSEGHIAYFRKPTRQELGYAMTMQNDPLKMSESLLKSCFLGGSDVFTTDTEFILGAVDLMEQLISIKKVELGKL